MRTKLHDLLQDIQHVAPLDERGTTIQEIKSIAIRNRAGVELACIDIFATFDGELVLVVDKQGEDDIQTVEEMISEAQQEHEMAII